MLRIFRMMPLRVADGLTQTAHKRIGFDPLVNLPNKGGPLTPVRFASLRMLVKLSFSFILGLCTCRF